MNSNYNVPSTLYEFELLHLLSDSTNVSITTNMGTIIFQVLVTNPESTDILDFSIVSVSTSNPDCPNYVAILDSKF